MSDKIQELNDQNVEEVSGGMIFNATGYEGDRSLPWEVLDNDDCSVLGAFSTREEAVEFAKSLGKNSYNAQEVDWATVMRLRKNPNMV